MKIEELLQEEEGKFSSTRLAFLLWVIGVLVVWILLSLKSGKLEGIDESIGWIIASLMGGKVLQKTFGEGAKPQNLKTQAISNIPETKISSGQQNTTKDMSQALQGIS